MKKKYNVKIYAPAEFARKAAQRIVRMINNAVAEQGICLMALSGGETPKSIYRLLGCSPLRERVPWRSVHFFFTDERSVPPDNPQSNFGMAHRELFSMLGIPEANIHRIAGEADPETAAAEYEKDLQKICKGAMVRFDIVLLGVGEDGHTASLFPGTKVLGETRKWASSVFVPRLESWRVTLTLPVLNHARAVLFLVAGEKKSSILHAIFHEASPPGKVPVELVQPANGTVVWMIDEAAAAKIS